MKKLVLIGALALGGCASGDILGVDAGEIKERAKSIGTLVAKAGIEAAKEKFRGELTVVGQMYLDSAAVPE